MYVSRLDHLIFCSKGGGVGFTIRDGRHHYRQPRAAPPPPPEMDRRYTKFRYQMTPPLLMNGARSALCATLSVDGDFVLLFLANEIKRVRDEWNRITE